MRIGWLLALPPAVRLWTLALGAITAATLLGLAWRAKPLQVLLA